MRQLCTTEFPHLNVVDTLHHKNNDFGLMTDAYEKSDVKTLRELVNSLRLQMEMHDADMQRLVTRYSKYVGCISIYWCKAKHLGHLAFGSLSNR